MPRTLRSETEHAWMYYGQHKRFCGRQVCTKGDIVIDDCAIVLPNNKVRSSRAFIFEKMQNGLLHGYYMHDGSKVPMKRTPGHVRTKGRKRPRVNKGVSGSSSTQKKGRKRPGVKKRVSGSSSTPPVDSNNQRRKRKSGVKSRKSKS